MASKFSNCNFAEKISISGNIGSIETYYQLKTADAKVVLQWCMDQGLIANRYQCPKCLKPMVLTPKAKNRDSFVWVCRINGQNGHYVKRSARVGTWFEKRNLPLSTYLLFLIYWCLEMKSKFIMEQLSIAAYTAADWASFCREVCKEIFIRRAGKIAGSEFVVEFQESKLNLGKKVRKSVFGGVERGTNNCFFAVVENPTSEVLLSVIEKHILPGTTIISNCWKSYDCHSHEGFRNLTVEHSIHFVDPDTLADMNSIDGTWSALKRYFHGTNKVRGELDSFLAVYMWRRKNSSVESRMRSLITMIKEVYPPRTEDVLSLVKKEKGESIKHTQSLSLREENRKCCEDALSSSKKENRKHTNYVPSLRRKENGKRSKVEKDSSLPSREDKKLFKIEHEASSSSIKEDKELSN